MNCIASRTTPTVIMPPNPVLARLLSMPRPLLTSFAEAWSRYLSATVHPPRERLGNRRFRPHERCSPLTKCAEMCGDVRTREPESMHAELSVEGSETVALVV